MKLNKNFVQISLTALITSAVFVIPMAYSGTGMFNPEPVASGRISWQYALDRQLEYLRDEPLRVRHPELDNNGTREPLKGFVFSAADLKEILNIDNTNKSGQTPDEVYFFLGQEGKFPDSFLHGLFRDSGHMRITAVGMRNKTLLNTNSSGGAEVSVFDKAEPCPPMCPN